MTSVSVVTPKKISRLSVEDIIETTGTSNLEDIEEIEILFLHCDEIDSLEYCANLKRFSMINNGLLNISTNLQYVQTTLLSLCLCDQYITKMENLELPHLVELFLHRNHIEVIEGLSKCKELKKLWLNQNKIKYISGLDYQYQLTELILNDNKISSLEGLENCYCLETLGLAANLVKSFEDLTPLMQLPNLIDLTFYDIHYGKCPIADLEGFREYMILHFRSLHYLDGVAINLNKLKMAEDLLRNKRQSFEVTLRHIKTETDYELNNIEIMTYNNGKKGGVGGGNMSRLPTVSNASIEEDVALMINELEILVADSRRMIAQHIELQNQILETNYTSLLHKLTSHTQLFLANMKDSKNNLMSETDLANSLIYIVNMLTNSDTLVKELLTDFSICTYYNNGSIKKNNNTQRNGLPLTLRDDVPNNNNNNSNNNRTKIPFQPITRKSPFFRKISLIFSFHRLHDADSTLYGKNQKSNSSVHTSASLMQMRADSVTSIETTMNLGSGRSTSSSSSAMNRKNSITGDKLSFNNRLNIELISLYQFLYDEYDSHSVVSMNTAISDVNAYTFVTLEQFQYLIQELSVNSKDCDNSNPDKEDMNSSSVLSSLVFFNEADLASAILEPVMTSLSTATVNSSSQSSTQTTSDSIMTAETMHDNIGSDTDTCTINRNENHSHIPSSSSTSTHISPNETLPQTYETETISQNNDGPYMTKAKQKKSLLLLCCRLDLDSIYGKKGQNIDSTRKLIFPPSKTGKIELLSEISSSNKPVNIPVEIEQYYQIYDISNSNNRNNSNYNLKNQSSEMSSILAHNQHKNDDSNSRISGNMYILPLNYLRMNRNLIQPNLRILFAGICLTPPEPEGFDKTDKHIDLLLTIIQKSQKMYEKQVINYENYIQTCYQQFLEYVSKDLLDPLPTNITTKQPSVIPTPLSINIMNNISPRSMNSNSSRLLQQSNSSRSYNNSNTERSNKSMNSNGHSITNSVSASSLVTPHGRSNSASISRKTYQQTTTPGYLLPRNTSSNGNRTTINSISNSSSSLPLSLNLPASSESLQSNSSTTPRLPSPRQKLAQLNHPSQQLQLLSNTRDRKVPFRSASTGRVGKK